MSVWQLEWSPVVHRDLRCIPWQTSARLAAAVMMFAETGRGPSVAIWRNDPRQLRLVVPGAFALLVAEPEAGTLLVWRAFAR